MAGGEPQRQQRAPAGHSHPHGARRTRLQTQRMAPDACRSSPAARCNAFAGAAAAMRRMQAFVQNGAGHAKTPLGMQTPVKHCGNAARACARSQVDGTLVNSKQQLTAGVEAAVQRAHAAGVPVSAPARPRLPTLPPGRSRGCRPAHFFVCAHEESGPPAPSPNRPHQPSRSRDGAPRSS